jgi:hypothetical protein
MARMQLSSCRNAPITTVNDRDQRAGDQIVFEQSKTDVLLAAVNRFSRRCFDESAYAHEHSFTRTKNPLMNLGVAELGREPQWEDRLKT